MEALAMIQTRSLSALIEASDAMLKSANVKFASYQKSGEGIVTVLMRGSVADCIHAVDVAMARAAKVGTVLSGQVIPYPDSSTNKKLPINV
ncbi:BMC domain-containing protein [Elusimicrobiota bacterium]